MPVLTGQSFGGRLHKVDVEKEADWLLLNPESWQDAKEYSWWEVVDTAFGYLLLSPTKKKAASRADINQAVYDAIKKMKRRVKYQPAKQGVDNREVSHA